MIEADQRENQLRYAVGNWYEKNKRGSGKNIPLEACVAAALSLSRSGWPNVDILLFIGRSVDPRLGPKKKNDQETIVTEDPSLLTPPKKRHRRAKEEALFLGKAPEEDGVHNL